MFLTIAPATNTLPIGMNGRQINAHVKQMKIRKKRLFNENKLNREMIKKRKKKNKKKIEQFKNVIISCCSEFSFSLVFCLKNERLIELAECREEQEKRVNDVDSVNANVMFV